MHLKHSVLFISILCMAFALAAKAKLPSPKIDNSISKTQKVDKQEASKRFNDISFDEQANQNEIEDRIQVNEPYKSLIQTTARFALAQTKISNHVNMDVAMDLLGKVGFMLSKPSVLFRVIKVAAVTIATIIATTFFFPGIYTVADSVWRNPVDAFNLDRYLSNGVREKSVMGIISSKTEDALSRVGLHDSTCRERSICHVGEMLKCTFPDTSEILSKFASENFSNSVYKENRFVKAFLSGFVDQNCTKAGAEDVSSHNCLGNVFNSILLSRGEDVGRQKNRYQTIQVGRA